jgi:glycerate kinase
MRVLLAFDKFKDALSAREACRVAAAALQSQHPSWELDLCPLTDGGEGFAEILTASAGGRLQIASVEGPRGEGVAAEFGLVDFAAMPPLAQRLLTGGKTYGAEAKVALVEMAGASGLALLPHAQRDPWQTSSFGTGELLRAAAPLADLIVLGIGGSATNDLGLGALAALGLKFLSANTGVVSRPVPAHWKEIAKIDGSVSAGFPPLFVACDVSNPLLGPTGCAAVYGPQKGLRPADLPALERESARLADLLCDHCGRPRSLQTTPGAGAAGGIAFGLMAAANARLVPGSTLTAAWLNLDDRIQRADIVITGEGRFDASSAQGKGPGAVVQLAHAAGKRTHVFAGQIAADSTAARLHAISPADWPRERAIQATAELLQLALEREFLRAP